MRLKLSLDNIRSLFGLFESLEWKTVGVHRGLGWALGVGKSTRVRCACRSSDGKSWQNSLHVEEGLILDALGVVFQDVVLMPGRRLRKHVAYGLRA